MVSGQWSAISGQLMGYRWCYCSGILVEWASWWNGHLGGMGILVEWASWWNWHLASFNRFWGGQDAHSTAIDPAGRMPTLLLFILFPIP
ncbi:MAG: hypothetical protein F6K26_54645 [Moorea sp. SIO2I5]|nr:hypothetical protein [Moorena sp. SIO2I5]